MHDSTITEEICTCVRFLKLKGVDKTIHIREEFLLVVWTEITRRSALSETVWGLYKTGINVDSMRAQGYDEAVNRGCHRGVQAKIIVRNENCEFLQNLYTDFLVALSLETPWVFTLFP